MYRHRKVPKGTAYPKKKLKVSVGNWAEAESVLAADVSTPPGPRQFTSSKTRPPKVNNIRFRVTAAFRLSTMPRYVHLNALCASLLRPVSMI